ncbi:MAG: Na/Pi cotransporter family protein [Lachnospira sp.]|nr:Na/Pi cotransporter family protein [Lachnospira sp.]
MRVFNLFTLFGGLALFLYGMDLLGKSLEKASGGRLEQILENLTSNVFKAVLLGAGVTGIIQSSSATTVMVVGFVNSGIMPLSRATGIIIGANIGTTVTAWILSLAGIQSDNVIVQLFKPETFSPVLAVVGIIFIMFAKREKLKNIGSIFIGFAILMFGMNTMSGAVAPLSGVKEFTDILLMFSNPLLGVAAGTLLTAIIQSSSASVGILQALCLTGRVTYGSAIPIIMGQNIGTCITAILSAMGANRNAKRAASIHLLFNLIATLIFLAVFYTLNIFIRFEFLEQNATPLGIAVFHTSFNVAAAIILLPFNKMFEKLAYLIIRKTRAELEQLPKRMDILEKRFLETPGYAISQCKLAARLMFDETRDSFILASGLLTEYDDRIFAKIKKSEEKVDSFEDQICNYLLEISKMELGAEESQMLSVLLHSITDIETISDYTCSIGIAYRNIQNKKGLFSAEAVKELDVIQHAVMDMLEETKTMFSDEQHVKEIYAYHQVIGELIDELREKHIERLKSGKCTIDSGLALTDILNYFERISVRCRRIANYLVQAGKEDLEIHDHEYWLPVFAYQEVYGFYKRKYAL